MDYPWPPPYRTRAVQQLIKGLAWGPPTSRAVWAALESPITATAAPTSTTSLPATPSHYIVCEDDRAVSPELQQAMARRCDSSQRIHASHSPYISQPDLIAEAIIG